MSPGGYIPTSFTCIADIAFAFASVILFNQSMTFQTSNNLLGRKNFQWLGLLTSQEIVRFATLPCAQSFESFNGDSQSAPPSYRVVDCVSLQAWLGWRRLGWGRAGLAIRPMSQSENIKRAANPHLAPITVSCPSHRPISSHYRPMWIPGKFLRPNLFNPIVPIWPGSFSVSLIITINKWNEQQWVQHQHVACQSCSEKVPKL